MEKINQNVPRTGQDLIPRPIWELHEHHPRQVSGSTFASWVMPWGLLKLYTCASFICVTSTLCRSCLRNSSNTLNSYANRAYLRHLVYLSNTIRIEQLRMHSSTYDKLFYVVNTISDLRPTKKHALKCASRIVSMYTCLLYEK